MYRFEIIHQDREFSKTRKVCVELGVVRETGARERDWVVTEQAGARDERIPGQSKEQEKGMSTDGTLGNNHRTY